MNERARFGRLGTILVTAGSAVGLGNIWRFPYMTGHDGGAAFLIVYFFCILLLVIPGMVAEFVVGRHGASNAARAFAGITPSGFWRWLGYLGVLTSMLILSFYSVVAGWCLQYMFASIGGGVSGELSQATSYFHDFSTGFISPSLMAIAFILITHWVVVKGVRNGIEKVSNVLMPVFFVLLVALVIASCLLPGAGRGIAFLLKPDFGQINSSIVIDALGQSFFSLSLGTACLCTYSSYFGRSTNLQKTAVQIAMIDTLIAILAGLMIFPAAFAVGVNPDSGPALIFITLPSVFQKAFASVPLVGYLVSVAFYVLLVLAALTSTISMHEIGTVFFREEFSIPRGKAAAIETAVCCLLAVLCALSVGAVPGLSIGRDTLMDFLNNLTSDYLLPIGSFFTCLLVGWLAPRKLVKDEFTNWGTVSQHIYKVWLFMVRIVSPVCILAVFLHQLHLL